MQRTRRNSVGTVSRRNISTQVADILRDMILTGEVSPGEALTHERVSDLLEVSTMPVREALLKLAHEGLVETQENRSFRVAAMTKKDIEDAFWLHRVISAELAARASALITPEQVAALRAVSEKQDLEGPVECYQFHGIINTVAASPRPARVLAQINQLIPEHFYEKSPEWKNSVLKAHGLIADALEHRRAQAARKAMEEHVQEAADYLVRYFTDHGFWERPEA
jgi:DNA-binding GntR family transcriptional regulator